METKNEFISHLEKLTLFILGVLFFVFPIAISTLTTDPFALPKQAILAGGALITLVLFSLKMLIEKAVRIRRTPFDLPIIILTVVLLLSSLFAVNKADALTSFVIFFFTVIVYFVTVNIAKNKNSAVFLTVSLIAGAVLSSTPSILSFFKIYILPYAFARIQTFTPLGSLLDQALYLGLLLPIAIYLLLPLLHEARKKLAENSSQKRFSAVADNPKLISFGIGTIIILIGLIITIYQLFYVQKPTILPFETGFQTAFATISQDPGRTLQGFLFGSGFGTYNVDFSRFKQISFNQNQDLWSLTFFRSSSFILELLATTGFLGVAAFIFLLIKVVREIRGNDKNLILLPVILTFSASLLLPFSLTIQTLLFVLLALFAVYEGLNTKKQDKFFDVDLQLVALRKGLITLESPTEKTGNSGGLLLPVLLNLIILALVLGIGIYSVQYITSDLAFQRSVVAASKNNGSQTYEEQTRAITKFPYRDGFYRIYSQTNLALANSLALQVPKDTAPDQNTQQNIITLIQQSINAARNATTVGPQTSLNWQNLSGIYRNLIGFGQNADSFAIASQQRAVLLDPNNPQQYITLGGIYYQLGQWDNAQNQFQIAVNLKPDFPNAYYNLGHALQEKKDIKSALAQYEIVRQLVANNNQAALKQITEEIKTLSPSEDKEEEKKPASKRSGKEPLEVDKSSSNLPPRNPQVKIPPPTSNDVESSTNSGR